VSERRFEPRRVDVLAFARAGSKAQGQWPQAELQRLTESALPSLGDRVPDPVQWQVQGELRPVRGGGHEIWLHLQADTSVLLECQRCLNPMAEALSVDRWFRFADSEDEAAVLDEEVEEDVLVASKRFDLLTLVEDEFLLALPIVPRHAECPAPLAGLAAGPAEVAAEPRRNPFAVLEGLRGPPAKK